MANDGSIFDLSNINKNEIHSSIRLINHKKLQNDLLKSESESSLSKNEYKKNNLASSTNTKIKMNKKNQSFLKKFNLSSSNSRDEQATEKMSHWDKLKSR